MILSSYKFKKHEVFLCFSVNIPVNCDKFHRIKDKQSILNELIAFGANRVMLNFETTLDGHVVLNSREKYNRQIEYMKEACTFFKQNGFEVGAWFWGLQFDAEFNFTKIKTLNGRTAYNFACPSDENFISVFQNCIRDTAKTGVDIILLNDDLRFGAWNGSFGCICKNHIKMICKDLGEEIEEEKLGELILSGGKNKYRDAFLKANKTLLQNYARKMREAVNEINPDIRLGFCACMSAFDIDGDAFELSKILAGNTKPILRLIGAPYWAACGFDRNKLQDAIELERMEVSWNKENDIEIIAEGDVYPRPRINCPAAFIEGFDTAIRASGSLNGILKICMDYVSNIGYENGYLKKYIKNKPFYEWIEKHFSNKKHCGIRVYESMKKASVMQLPNVLGLHSDMEKAFYSSAARILSANAIPTVYEGFGTTAIALGENAYALTEENFSRGLILDALSAKILWDKGIDIGIKSFGNAVGKKYQYFCEDDNFIIANVGQTFACEFDEKCKILSYVTNNLENSEIPFCYQYQNDKGQRFLVFNCIAKNCENLLKQYANAKMITDSVKWLSGESLPAYCPDNPNLYIQCAEDENCLVIGIWNFFEDEAIEPVIKLSRGYKQVEFTCGSGVLNGNTIELTDIPPFEFRGIVLKK